MINVDKSKQDVLNMHSLCFFEILKELTAYKKEGDVGILLDTRLIKDTIYAFKEKVTANQRQISEKAPNLSVQDYEWLGDLVIEKETVMKLKELLIDMDEVLYGKKDVVLMEDFFCLLYKVSDSKTWEHCLTDLGTQLKELKKVYSETVKQDLQLLFKNQNWTELKTRCRMMNNLKAMQDILLFEMR